MSGAVESPGPRLRRERERQGLSVQKAADEMHLDTWVIDALETDTYTRLGPAVYAKGHLRKYAALLGLPVGEIVAGYESLHIGAQQPQATSVRSLVPNSVLQNLPWGRLAGGAAVLMALVGAAWWQSSQQRQAAAAAAAAAAKQAAEAPPADVVPVPESAPPASAAAGAPPVTPPQPAASPPVPAPAAVPAPAPEAGAGRARLRMSFSADSWVDVRDARGKRVFAGNGRANSVKLLAGEAPLRVYLGFASGVQLEINERTVAIGPQFVNGDVARFEAGADGVLRRDSHAARPRG